MKIQILSGILKDDGKLAGGGWSSGEVDAHAKTRRMHEIQILWSSRHWYFSATSRIFLLYFDIFEKSVLQLMRISKVISFFFSYTMLKFFFKYLKNIHTVRFNMAHRILRKL